MQRAEENTPNWRRKEMDNLRMYGDPPFRVVVAHGAPESTSDFLQISKTSVEIEPLVFFLR
ncbi:hypothetical protein BG32_03400 [Mesotoga sp. HF07.pep.5.2.highcov]|nr:hypothetical protein V513_03665 [Mesotoga sp. H07.pep.5.3]RLL91734.1 hypothetical protein BG32_03400 [Mesotoga sp. HF07.pep.5.2.highcov]